MNEELTDIIKKLEVELLQPEVRKSTTRLNELIADDFLEFGVSGNHYNKKDILESLPTLSAVKYEVFNMEVRELSTDTMLITYNLEKEILESGEKSRSLRSSIWQSRNDNWQMTFHQGTAVKG